MGEEGVNKLVICSLAEKIMWAHHKQNPQYRFSFIWLTLYIYIRIHRQSNQSSGLEEERNLTNQSKIIKHTKALCCQIHS